MNKNFKKSLNKKKIAILKSKILFDCSTYLLINPLTASFKDQPCPQRQISLTLAVKGLLSVVVTQNFHCTLNLVDIIQ